MRTITLLSSVVPANTPPEARFGGPFTDQQVVTARVRAIRPPGTPEVDNVAPTSHGSLPPNILSPEWYGRPGSTLPRTSVPIISWNGYTYWMYSYTDNRTGTAIVAYDAAGNIVKQWDKPGARYITGIAVNPNRTIRLIGQFPGRITWSATTRQVTSYVPEAR